MATTKSNETETKFTFDHDGKSYTFEKDFSVVSTPKWLRANRRRDELDLAFTILEEIAGDEALEAIDEMSADEFQELSKQVNKAISAAVSA